MPKPVIAKAVFVALAGMATTASVASAVTIDFNDLPFTQQSGLAPFNHFAPLPESVITDQLRPLGVVFGREGVSAGVAVFRSLGDDRLAVAALDAQGLVPGTEGVSEGFNGDLYFRFVVPGTDVPAVADGVRFVVGDSGIDLDVFDIRSYGAGDQLLNTQSFTSESYRTVTIPVPGVSRVEVDFTGPLGYFLDDLTFTVVPEPGGASLLLAAGCVFLPRRRVRAPR